MHLTEDNTMSVKQKFTGKSVKNIDGPTLSTAIPPADSMVKAKHILASKGLTNELRK